MCDLDLALVALGGSLFSLKTLEKIGKFSPLSHGLQAPSSPLASLSPAWPPKPFAKVGLANFAFPAPGHEAHHEHQCSPSPPHSHVLNT